MEFHIAHLYYDILNLYGEHGNVNALKRQLETQGIEPVIHFLSVDDEIDVSKFDLIYIGAGTEENEKFVLTHLLKYKDDILSAIEKGTFFLITGSALNFFGKKWIQKDETELECLGAFDYEIKEEPMRMIDECYFTCDFLKTPVIGFQNQCTVMKNNDATIFSVKCGVGMYPNSKREGVHKNHFYGTYLIGPVLVRNPELLQYLVMEMIHAKYPDVVFQPFDLDLDLKAHDHYIDRYFSKPKIEEE